MSKSNKQHNNVPASYDFINTYNSFTNPSTVHVENSGLSYFFYRYLTQKVASVFEFTNLPEDWAENYFVYTLLLHGFVAVIDTEKYGVIPQHATQSGMLNVMYQPTSVMVGNPLLPEINQPLVIGKDCSIIKMQPDYGGVWDLVSYYGDLLALSAEAVGMNLVNSKLSYVFMAENQAAAESLKVLYDNIASGNPAVFADKDLFNEDGKPSWLKFDNNLQQTYIADKLFADMHRIQNLFNTEIGIPNANFEKSERLITDEVNANNVDTMSKAKLWLAEIKKGCKQTNEMFGTNIDVRLRFENEYDGQVGKDNPEEVTYGK